MRPIDAHAVTDMLQTVNKRDGLWGAVDRAVLSCVDSFIREFPTLDLKQEKHGEWKLIYGNLSTCENEHDQKLVACSCTNCEEIMHPFFAFSNYCPKCGARMGGRKP